MAEETQQLLFEKPKVYQGVRVKITVKELLQQRRAHQATSGGTLSRNSGVQFSEAVLPSSAAPCFEPEPISAAPNYFQPRQFSSCMSCEENPSCLDQVLESYLPAETLLDHSLSSTQGIPPCFPDSFQATPFCFNQSLAPGSPSDSSTLSSPLEYSYSPPQQPSLAPVTYNSPSSLDTRNCGYPSEEYSYHHFHSHPQYSCCTSSSSSSVCYCTSCETDHLDTIKVSEYFSYPDTDCIDYSHSLPTAMTDDFYRREADCDICYS
ncbi:colorectal cancer-associated protein 2 [Dromiciops gliroides]|uniref:colorectal cancer-associated protein 2 n=1 Tax=Dromiciops gliroides TaxID=33562 RepID=UPI001CC58B8B|nr:colorectal cancer-associated protein 2 [Dromiciops gliroides]